MLGFKLYSLLNEASFKHFSHLGLNPENSEHKDLIDAYNAGHSSNDPSVPRNPNQIKSIDQLKSSVKPHLDNIETQRKHDADDKEAFASGEAIVIHHNPETGAKVTQVTSQRGSCAAGASSTWCTGQRNSSSDMVKHYDDDGSKSFVFSFPNEKKKNLRKIGAYGQYDNSEGESANFQDAENHTVPESEWNRLVKEHGLDKIKHLKGSVRGIGISQKEKEEYAKDLKQKFPFFSKSTASTQDILHAKSNSYLTKDHEKRILSDKSSNLVNAIKSSDDPEFHKAIVNHPKAGDHILTKVAENTIDPKIRKAIINHPKAGDQALSTVAYHTNDPKIHKEIMNHPNVGDLALLQISRKTKDPEVHKAIMNHPNAGDRALWSVANNIKDPEVHKAIMNHPNAGDRALSSIAENTKDPEVHKAIMNHPNAGDRALSSVAENTKDPEIHKTILKHPKVGDETLSSVAENTKDPEVHKAIMNHPNAGGAVLEDISKNTKDPEVHKAIVNHPKVFESTKINSQKFLDTNNPYHIK